MKRASYSTTEVAHLIGVDRCTLVSWLAKGLLSEPMLLNQGGKKVRIWTAEDIQTARKFKEEHYCAARANRKHRTSNL